MKERACTKCKFITTERICPNCGSENFSNDWSGIVYIINVEDSEVAKQIGAKKQGRYAIKVR